jgi:hypothetical protein
MLLTTWEHQLYTKRGLCSLMKIRQEYAKSRQLKQPHNSSRTNGIIVTECKEENMENINKLLKANETTIQEAIYQASQS